MHAGRPPRTPPRTTTQRKERQAHLLLGIAQLRQGAHSEARQSFTTSVEHADGQLQHTPENYYALDRKALALCGVALTGQSDRLLDAIAAFRAARAITTAPSIVARTLRLLDTIAASDTDGSLTSARTAAQGAPPSSWLKVVVLVSPWFAHQPDGQPPLRTPQRARPTACLGTGASIS